MGTYAQRFLRGRSQKFFIGLAAAGIIALCLIGGGVYAALGGGGSPVASGDIELQRGLVGWWKMDGNAKDATPYANNWTVNGAVPGVDRTSRAGSAYNFTAASSNYLSLGTGANYNYNEFSVSLWARGNSSTQTHVKNLIGKGDWNTSNNWYLGFKSGTALSFVYGVGWDAGPSYSLGSFDVTQWHHYVGVASSTQLKLYLDGSLVSTATISHGSVVSALDLQIARSSYYGNFFDGSVDDVRMWNRAISQSEATALYGQYDTATKVNAGKKGLIGQWKMNGNAKDDSPLANNATVTAATLTTDRKGKSNGAYDFNGSSAYMSAGNPSNLSLTPSTFTWSTWVYSSNISKDQMFLSKQGANYFRILSSRLFASLNIGGVQKTQFASTTLSNNTWYHVAVTYNGSAMTIYLNGIQDGQLASLSGNVTFTTGGFDMGRWTGADPRYLQGRLSDVRLYNRALSQQELASLYNSYNSQISIGGSGASGSVSLGKGLVGDWPLNGNAKDATPYADNGTVSGATLTTDRKGRANSAYAFDGSTSSLLAPNNGILNLAGDMSVSAWIKPTSIGGFLNGAAPIVQKRLANGTTSYVLELKNGGGIGVEWYSVAGGWKSVVTASGLISTGSWYHVSMTRTATSTTIYINGSPATTSAIGATDAITNTQQFNIGSGTTGAYSIFSGSIDDVRVWNRALIGAEVTALYQGYR